MAVTLALVAGCAGDRTPSPAPSTAPSPSPSAAPTATSGPSPSSADARAAGWRADLAAVVPALEAHHPEPYHSTSKAELEAALATLDASIPQATDDQLMVGLLRVLAMVSAAGRDGHTGAFIWGTGSYPVHSLPLRLWLFGDGVYVVDALAPYADLVGARIDAVAGQATADVLRALDPLIPRDNPTTVTLLTPRYLLIPEVLAGLGIVGDAGEPVELRLTGPEPQSARTVSVQPVTMAAYNDWAGPYGLHLPARPGVRYLARQEEPLWFEPLETPSTLYVQYNRVEPPGRDIVDGLRAALEAPDLDRIVVDLRHDYGGQTSAFRPILDLLVAADHARSGRLAVITGRNTFSAASLFAAGLERETSAIFVGEPMGGSPNLYGDPGTVELEHTGIALTIAEQFFVGSEPGDERLTLEPDVLAPLSAADYFAGRDPALAAVLALDD
jgi:hypothetical protein